MNLYFHSTQGTIEFCKAFAHNNVILKFIYVKKINKFAIIKKYSWHVITKSTFSRAKSKCLIIYNYLDLNGETGPYPSNILLKHTELQTLVEAELTVLPRPLHLMVSLHKKKENTSFHLSICSMTNVRQVTVRRTCMTWCRTPIMPWVAALKSGLVVESSESVVGQRWRTSNKALPLSLTWDRWENRKTGVTVDRHTGKWAERQTVIQLDRRVYSHTDRYLCEVSRDLLVQLLVFLYCSFQFWCSWWPRTFRAHLNPSLHS